MLVKIMKSVVSTSRGSAVPGPRLTPLPREEAERLAARGDVELVESAACKVVQPVVGSRSRGYLKPGSQPTEILADEAAELAAAGIVELVTGRQAERVRELGIASTQSADDIAAEGAAAEAAELERRKRRAVALARAYLREPEDRRGLSKGWDRRSGSRVGDWIAGELGIDRRDAERAVGEALELLSGRVVARVA